jgi:subtilisin family serine protease
MILPRKTFEKAAIISILVFFLAFITCSFASAAAPDFNLPDLNGDFHNIADPGNKTLLVFISTDCPACRRILPALDNFNLAQNDSTDIFVIAAENDANKVLKFLTGKSISFTVLIDSSAAVTKSYNIKSVPHAILLDKNKNILRTATLDQDFLHTLESKPHQTSAENNSPISADQRFRNQPASSNRRNRYILKFPTEKKHQNRITANEKKHRFRTHAKNAGAKVIHDFDKIPNKMVIETNPENLDALKADLGFESAHLDKPVSALLEDSAYQVNADYAWDNAVTGQDVRVCVIDTGIDYNHPDLLSKVVAQYNFNAQTEDARDDNGHGTHVAGIIASQGLNFRGLSYDASLLAAKALDATGNGFASDVALALDWCVNNDADVINLSLGEGLYSSTCDNEEMAIAVNNAVDAGVVVVCASGNDGITNQLVAPACASKAIAVGSVDKLDNIASYSNGGTELDLVAPGGDTAGGQNYAEIVSTFSTLVAENPEYCLYLVSEMCYDNYLVVDGTRYIKAVGTSMAAPHVAAAAALLLEKNPALTPAQVKQTLEQNADDLGAQGRDDIFGHGRINIQKALDNIPPAPGEFVVNITEPNTPFQVPANQPFTLTADIACYSADGCGQVSAFAQLCQGLDCDNFADINDSSAIITFDQNPNDVGSLSGFTIDTDAPVIFDAHTALDVSQNSTQLTINPASSPVGQTFITDYATGDIEPEDGIGTNNGDAAKTYAFDIPAGVLTKVSIKLVNDFVVQFDSPDAGWYFYTSDAADSLLNLIGDCTPITGGGGETPSPDCWYVSQDPNVLADFNPSQTSYIRIVSHDVGENDWLTFNDIELFFEYQPDPNNDTVNNYYIKFNLADFNSADTVLAAELQLNVTNPAPQSLVALNITDNSLSQSSSATEIHNADEPSYQTSVQNPVKSFAAENTGLIRLNVKTSILDALAADQNSIAFNLIQSSTDQPITLDASQAALAPKLTISTQAMPDQITPDTNEPNQPTHQAFYPFDDVLVTRDVTDDSYTLDRSITTAQIGSAIAPQYSTGDLEPNDGLGAIGENAAKTYAFNIPPGDMNSVSIRIENYLVIQFDPPDAGWSLYTADANDNSLHLIGDCSPITGGGGEPPAPDCWFTSSDPDVLADLAQPTSYIKLVSHDVAENDWLTFNDIEVIVDYSVDPNNDDIARHCLQFDISNFSPDMDIDLATLTFNVTQTNPHAVAAIDFIQPFIQSTGAYTLYNSTTPAYSALNNPIKTVTCDTIGQKTINVKAAFADALAAADPNIAFRIAEQNADALFTIDTATPPTLDVYLKTPATQGTVKWTLTPVEGGQYTLRVLAENTAEISAVSDNIVVNVIDPNLPVINSVDCLVNSIWQDCTGITFGDQLQKIRIDSTDPQQIPNVNLKLTNIPDANVIINNTVPYSAGSFIYDILLTINDSGTWQIDVTTSDDDNNSAEKSICWLVPWGALNTQLSTPTVNITTPKSSTFTASVSADCLNAECPPTQLSILLNNPTELVYDDASAEDYGDIGATDGFLAVKITPQNYPAQIKTARFYIWDNTTYPFELRIWDDDGSSNMPGSLLVTPFTVDPVSASNNLVSWFDVDLADLNIIINDGDFYIGWRQIQGAANNQVGFDTSGPAHARTFGYLPSLGWFNLNEYCAFFPEFCGNIMIRAITGPPANYAGQLPTSPLPAPLYTSDNHPAQFPSLKPGNSVNADFSVHAVGATNSLTTIAAHAQNSAAENSSAPITVSITSPLTPCKAANLDAINPIDFKDFAVLAAKWLDSPPNLAADTNQDQAINPLDLAAIAQYWLDSCQ